MAESLGKKSSGILPVISVMLRDNHSLMQYYLDGVKNHFFTFFLLKKKTLKKLKIMKFQNHILILRVKI